MKLRKRPSGILQLAGRDGIDEIRVAPDGRAVLIGIENTDDMPEYWLGIAKNVLQMGYQTDWIKTTWKETWRGYIHKNRMTLTAYEDKKIQILIDGTDADHFTDDFCWQLIARIKDIEVKQNESFKRKATLGQSNSLGA